MHPAGEVLLLAPSAGLGGGIERYVDTVESALHEGPLPCRRLNLATPGSPPSLARKIAFGRLVRAEVRQAAGPVRLVVTHAALLPVVEVVARLPRYAGASVFYHGREVWSGRGVPGARTVRRWGVRVVAGSNFTAGALAGTCRAVVLNPGLTRDWYELLRAEGAKPHIRGGDLEVLTTFRLADWRKKGAETVVAALRRLDDPRVRLTICGSGAVPEELERLVRDTPRCMIVPNLPDQELAARIAGADLFVLATRTREGDSSSGEGFGLVLLEAQLAGTPVIAPAYGGSGDAFVPGMTGLNPVDESSEALAAVITEMLADEVRRKQMSETAREWAGSRFEPDAYRRATLRVFLGPKATSVPGAGG